MLQVPPEMDRHLGFLEIPQPVDNKIEVRQSFSRVVQSDEGAYAIKTQLKAHSVSLWHKGTNI